MSNVLNKDIEAVNLLVSQFISAIKNHEHRYDKTFISVVKEISIKNSITVYTIQDESGVERKIKCAIPNSRITIGQNVWVKIPCGNIEKMFICGINE